MKVTPSWIDRPTPEDGHREKLASALSITKDDPQLDCAAQACIRASRLQQSNKAKATDRTELRRNMEPLRKALNRIRKTLRYMPGALYLDDSYYLANDRDPLLLSLWQVFAADSGFEVMAERIPRAVDDFADTLESPASGRNPDTAYTLGVINLADLFEQAFPEHPLTHHKRTLIASFAGLWLANISNAAPQRHIRPHWTCATPKAKNKNSCFLRGYNAPHTFYAVGNW